MTGASVADRGDRARLRAAATPTSPDGDEWLASLERFGIVSARAVLLEGATLQQNLAMPFTLQIDPVAPEMAERVAALARECGLIDGSGETRGEGGPAAAGRRGPADVRARAHLARAVALDPVLLVLEHPTAGVPGRARRATRRTSSA